MRELTTLQLMSARVPNKDVGRFREVVGSNILLVTEPNCQKYADTIDFRFLCMAMLSDQGRALATTVKQGIDDKLKFAQSKLTARHQDESRRIIRDKKLNDVEAFQAQTYRSKQYRDELEALELTRRRSFATLFAVLYNRDEENRRAKRH